MCLLQNLKLTRLRVGEVWVEYLGAKTWRTIQEVALRVKDKKFVLPKGVATMPDDMLQIVESR